MTRIFTILPFCVFLCAAPAPASAGDNAWNKIALDAVHILSLTGDPARPSTLYAVTSQGLKKSLDSGNTWTGIGADLPGDIPPNSVAVNYLNSKEIYVGYEGLGIFKTLDGGSTWRSLNEGLPNLYVRCIVISPKDPNLLYVGIQDGVAISTNGGKQWHMSSGFRRAVNVNCIAIDPRNPQYLFAGTGGAGVFKSGNGGVSWIDVNEGLSSLSVLSLYIDPEDPDVVLAGAYHPATPTDFYVGQSNGGAFRTVDGGRTWKETGLLTITIFSFAAHAQYPGVVYAGAWGGAYRSTDRGATWTDINTGLDNPFLHKVYVLPGKPPVILAGTTYGLLSYTDANIATLPGAGDDVPPLVRYGLAAVAVLAVAVFLLVRRSRRRASPDSRKPVW
ncbi:MAG: hypothetical protein LBU06_11005 [Desulfovibrio sp.]|jgi:photosystem II stability/assembly factor-like uncharacterized protein|nr:hypothetical protein [Desulfovibrio sp.]